MRASKLIKLVNCKFAVLLSLTILLSVTTQLDLNVVEAQSSAADSWAEETPMPIARSFLGAAAVDDKIYAIGGRNEDTVFGLNQQYDPETGIWVDKAEMPTPRFGFAIATYQGKIYCIGGAPTLHFSLGNFEFNLSTANEVYDPATDTWTTQASMPQGSDAKAAVVNNKIYVISSSMLNPNLRLTQVYDPQTNQWTTKTSIPRGTCSAAAAIENKIYVFGGYDYSANHNIAQIYDTDTDSWTLASSPPVYMGGYIASAVTTGTLAAPKIHVFGLTSAQTPYGNGSNANQIYYPNTDSWEVKASMPTSRHNFGTALVGNQVYVVGGEVRYYPYPGDTGSSTKYFATNERYTLEDVPVAGVTPFTTAKPNSAPTQTNNIPSENSLPLEAIVIGTCTAVVVFAGLVVFWKTRHRSIKTA